MNNTPTPMRSGGYGKWRLRSLAGLCVCALALGLLIWAKLQLVTGMPRTAVATPEQQDRPPFAGHPEKPASGADTAEPSVPK